MNEYDSFINSKRATMPPSGFSVERDTLHGSLFDFQRDLVRWALRRGWAEFYQLPRHQVELLKNLPVIQLVH